MSVPGALVEEPKWRKGGGRGGKILLFKGQPGQGGRGRRGCSKMVERARMKEVREVREAREVRERASPVMECAETQIISRLNPVICMVSSHSILTIGCRPAFPSGCKARIKLCLQHQPPPTKIRLYVVGVRTRRSRCGQSLSAVRLQASASF